MNVVTGVLHKTLNLWYYRMIVLPEHNGLSSVWKIYEIYQRNFFSWSGHLWCLFSLSRKKVHLSIDLVTHWCWKILYHNVMRLLKLADHKLPFWLAYHVCFLPYVWHMRESNNTEIQCDCWKIMWDAYKNVHSFSLLKQRNIGTGNINTWNGYPCYPCNSQCTSSSQPCRAFVSLFIRVCVYMFSSEHAHTHHAPCVFVCV